jgi:hypothetical protein
MTNKLDHSLPSQMHDVAVRGLTPTNRVSNRVKWNGLRPLSSSVETSMGSSM